MNDPDRVADQVGLLDLEMVEQAHHVGRHFGAVLLGVVRLIALAVPPAIQGNHLKPVRAALSLVLPADPGPTCWNRPSSRG